MGKFKLILGTLLALLFITTSNPASARWVSTDPVQANPNTGADFNRYRYANNNPYRFNDPDGRAPCDGPSTCAIDRDISAMNRGDMSREEFMDRSEARGAGAAIGLAMVVTAVAAPEVLPLVGAGSRQAAKEGIKTTAHGAQRIAGANATRGGVLNATEVRAVQQVGRTMTQADGAAVRIVTNQAGKSNVVVSGEKGVITTFKNLSEKSLERLSKRYGWE